MSQEGERERARSRAAHEPAGGCSDDKRLEAITRSAAHDFNNLMTSVLGHVGLARLDLADLAKARAHLDRIEEAANRAANLCQRLLEASSDA